MNILDTYNERNKEHPFHTQTTSYLPFSKLPPWMQRAWWGMVLWIVLPWPKLKLLIWKVMHPGNFVFYEDFCAYSDIFRNSVLVSADDALMYLTMCQCPHFTPFKIWSQQGFLKVVLVATCHPNFHNAELYYMLCILVIKWFFLLSLPFVVKTVKEWLIWFCSVLVLQVFWHFMRIFGVWHVGGPFPKGPITFSYADIFNMLNYQWLFDTWNKCALLLLKWHFRLDVILLLFSIFVLLSLLDSWRLFTQKYHFLAKRVERISVVVHTRPRLLLINMLLSASLFPILIDFIKDHYWSPFGVHDLLAVVILTFLSIFCDLRASIKNLFLLSAVDPKPLMWWTQIKSTTHSTVQRYPRAARAGGSLLGFYSGWRVLDWATGTGQSVGSTTNVYNNINLIPPPGSRLITNADGSVDVVPIPTRSVTVRFPLGSGIPIARNPYSALFSRQDDMSGNDDDH